MPFRARLALGAIPAALLPLAPVPAYASASGYVNVAAWTGRAAFGDCGADVCVTATTSPVGVCEDTVGAAVVRLNQCRATLTASYRKQGVGTTRFCVGIGNGDLVFVDSAGQMYPPIPVVVAASDGTITYSGRYVDAFGRETFSVEGVIEGACGASRAWSGTLDTYRG